MIYIKTVMFWMTSILVTLLLFKKRIDDNWGEYIKCTLSDMFFFLGCSLIPLFRCVVWLIIIGLGSYDEDRLRYILGDEAMDDLIESIIKERDTN